MLEGCTMKHDKCFIQVSFQVNLYYVYPQYVIMASSKCFRMKFKEQTNGGDS